MTHQQLVAVVTHAVTKAAVSMTPKPLDGVRAQNWYYRELIDGIVERLEPLVHYPCNWCGRDPASTMPPIIK